jgi:hypothetical protein
MVRSPWRLWKHPRSLAMVPILRQVEDKLPELVMALLPSLVPTFEQQVSKV